MNATATGSVIQITDPMTGATKDWKRLSARNKELLATFPPIDGWAIKIEATQAPVNFLAASGGEVVAMRFDATLTHPDGRVIATGSALQGITSPDDWAIGESRARHRLCEALGFGGEVLDLDEERLVRAQGGQTQAPAPQSEAPAPAPDKTPAKPPKVSATKAPAKAQTPAGDAEQPPSAMLLRQIADRAKMLGIEAPECATQAQAKAAWKQLLTAPRDG